jgi:hypothetical protein
MELVLALVLLYASFFLVAMANITGMLIFVLAVSVVASLLGAAVWVLARGGWRQATGVQRLITVLGLLMGLGMALSYWLLDLGQAVDHFNRRPWRCPSPAGVPTLSTRPLRRGCYSAGAARRAAR